LNSSLAQSAGELWPEMSRPLLWPTRDLRVQQRLNSGVNQSTWKCRWKSRHNFRSTLRSDWL